MYKNHLEIRVNDATSSPYAMVGAIIAAALDRKLLTIGAAPNKFPLASSPSPDERNKKFLFCHDSTDN